MDPTLEFQQLDLQLTVAFWMKYNTLKLDKFKLSMDPIGELYQCFGVLFWI